MAPFEYIILFFSFVFTLGLTHLLFAATRMLRHRRELVFSWPHALWMLTALLSLPLNWLSMYDLRHMHSLSLTTIAFGLLAVIANYFICALVSPDFEEGEGFDLVEFHRREGVTYIGAFLVLLVLSIAANFAAAAALGLDSWTRQTPMVMAMALLASMALVVKRPWVQLAVPIAMVVLYALFTVVFYPELTA